MKKYFLLILVVCLSAAQGKPDIVFPKLFNSQNSFYSKNYLSAKSAGRGYTGIASGQGFSDVFLNPANLNSSSIYFEYTLKNTYEFFSGIEFKNTFSDGVIGYAKSYQSFSYGFIASTKTSLKEDYGTFQTTSEMHPNGNDNRVHNYGMEYQFDLSLPISYEITDEFKIGVTLIGSNLYTTNYSMYSNSSGNKFYINAQIGFVSNLSENVTLGLNILPSRSLDKIKLNTDADTGSDMPHGGEFFNSELEIEDQPGEFGLGVKYSGNNFIFYADFRHTDYGRSETSNDTYDFNLGFDYLNSEELVLRAGFYKAANNYAGIDSYNIYEDQYFLTFGGSYSHNNTIIHIALMDSKYLLGGDQVYLKLGLEYSL